MNKFFIGFLEVVASHDKARCGACASPRAQYAGCTQQAYCGARCQAKDWQRHKHACAPPYFFFEDNRFRVVFPYFILSSSQNITLFFAKIRRLNQHLLKKKILPSIQKKNTFQTYPTFTLAALFNSMNSINSSPLNSMSWGATTCKSVFNLAGVRFIRFQAKIFALVSRGIM